MDSSQILPPATRTSVCRGISAAAKNNEFVLQVCQHCERVQYPPRECCQECLHDELKWEKVATTGELLSHTVLHVSTHAFFREHGPVQIALVKLDCGPVLFAHMAYDDAKSGDRVSLENRSGLSGEGIFVVIVETGDAEKQLSGLNRLLA